jgi:hypothetical protein
VRIGCGDLRRGRFRAGRPKKPVRGPQDFRPHEKSVEIAGLELQIPCHEYAL